MDELTLLHRQVHPSFVLENKISTQVFEEAIQRSSQIASSVFTPKSTDDGFLSVYNGEKHSAKDSYQHYVSQNFESAGVVAVTKGECGALSLPCIDDNDPFDGHASIDFKPLGNNAIKAKAKLLKNFATNRGWQFQPS